MGDRIDKVFGEAWGIRSLDGYAAPASPANRAEVARFATVMAGGYVLVGTAVMLGIWVTGTEVPGMHLGNALIAAAVALVLIGPVWGAFHRLGAGWLQLIPPIATVVMVIVGVNVGPTFETSVVMAMVIIALMISVSMNIRVTLLHFIHLGAGYAIVLADNHVDVPLGRWIGTMGGSVIVAAVVESLLSRTRQLAQAERAASESAEAARTELATLNSTLEMRVVAQVADLERLSELERFLPTAVVDAVLSGDRDLLEPHRGEIAVLFCDLRGFTAFASNTQPEEVHELLDGYFGLLGEHAQRHGATVGAFTGDGIMAFFNDPLPVEDPAHKALHFALGLQAPVRELLARWRRVGHDLGFGVGIAYGYANIGMIGFAGRRDYTALGPVVNLAARLCSEAPPDGILLDRRASLAVEGTVELGEPFELHLKGFERVMVAQQVVVEVDA